VNETASDVDIDLNNDKAATWHIGVTGETLSASFNGIYGSSNSIDLGKGFTSDGITPIGALEADKDIIYDLIVRWDPFDWFSWYVNGNYRETDTDQIALVSSPPDSDFTAWGVSTAGRFAITDKLGFALRGEYTKDADSFYSALPFVGPTRDFAGVALGDETEIWGLTGTVDYALTDQLKVRTELRYDLVDVEDGDSDVFIDEENDSQDDQLVAGVEVIYSF
jgi:hypothetical protein